ncbi:hypothetical protein X777_10967 [Ooceraea biroi]|uniref:Uncharacterized protein n=1 Tax=Ooceraea biroi TaxID=2015173 RepID=A0A026W4V3_OOCBI|nr:hypothetical protein X777_10967 [Ooceraea biroi]
MNRGFGPKSPTGLSRIVKTAFWLSPKITCDGVGNARTGSAACTELEVFRADRLYIGTDDAPRSFEDPVSLGSQTARYCGGTQVIQDFLLYYHLSRCNTVADIREQRRQSQVHRRILYT